MIKVFDFNPAWGLPTPSASALKLKTYMRMADIPYECEYVQRPQNSPKGTVPWIDDGGMLLADSAFIIDYLKEKFGDRLNDSLPAEKLATAHAVRRMLEENLGRIIGYTRWLVEANWPVTRDVAFAAMDEPWKSEISARAREKIREDMVLHGIGRHTADEVQEIGLRDVRAVETLIGDKPYLLDDRPREFDATVFGVIVQFLVPPLVCSISDYARSSPVLSGYCARMLKQYFPEFPMDERTRA
jgi:glutathione S-transferase